MEHFILAALIGHGSAYTDDVDVETAGAGTAVHVDAGYRVHKNLSLGAFLGSMNWDAEAYDYWGEYYLIHETLTDIGVRVAGHAGPCFAALGLGSETYSWRGDTEWDDKLSLTTIELGCTYEHVQVAYLHTSAKDDYPTTTSSNRFMLGFAF